MSLQELVLQNSFGLARWHPVKQLLLICHAAAQPACRWSCSSLLAAASPAGGEGLSALKTMKVRCARLQRVARHDEGQRAPSSVGLGNEDKTLIFSPVWIWAVSLACFALRRT